MEENTVEESVCRDEINAIDNLAACIESKLN